MTSKTFTASFQIDVVPATESQVRDAYQSGELGELFKLVQSRQNWKAPINALLVNVPHERLSLIAAAVEFYTATPARIWAVSTNAYRVRAVGYQMGPAGDH